MKASGFSIIEFLIYFLSMMVVTHAIVSLSSHYYAKGMEHGDSMMKKVQCHLTHDLLCNDIRQISSALSSSCPFDYAWNINTSNVRWQLYNGQLWRYHAHHAQETPKKNLVLEDVTSFEIVEYSAFVQSNITLKNGFKEARITQCKNNR